jgi:hypothetical protein
VLAVASVGNQKKSRKATKEKKERERKIEMRRRGREKSLVAVA